MVRRVNIGVTTASVRAAAIETRVSFLLGDNDGASGD